MLVSQRFSKNHAILAWKMFSTFIWNGNVQASLISIICFSLVKFCSLFIPDTFFRQIICNGSSNGVELTSTRDFVSSDILLIDIHAIRCRPWWVKIFLNTSYLPDFLSSCWIHIACKSSTCSDGSIKRSWAGLKDSGYQCCSIWTRAFTSFHTSIDNSMSLSLFMVSCLPICPFLPPAGRKLHPHLYSCKSAPHHVDFRESQS